MPTLLVVDDEPAIRHAFQRVYVESPISIVTASTAAEACAHFEASRPDVVVLDVHLPDASGLETFHKLHAIDNRIPIILITGHGTTDLAIAAIQEGAFDYLIKPLELPVLRQLIDQAIRSSRLTRVPATIPDLEPSLPQGDSLIGRCPAMQEVYKSIGRVAGQDVTVLILGESGCGKELVARAIYQHSRRADKPFVAINCGAIPENLVESELFGHEKGAFTSADRRRIGRFEQADGGTVFLDEVGELPLLAQVKMLRVLQDSLFERVGGETTIHTNVRVIAATNSGLEQMVESGQFRSDLYFRLNVFAIRLPLLRERGDDIPMLIEHYVRRYSQELNRHVLTVAPEVMTALCEYAWPGNVRELQSVIKQSLLTMKGTALMTTDLPSAITATAAASRSELPALEHKIATLFNWDEFVAGQIAGGSTDLHANALMVMEREVLMRVLRHTSGNQLQAAKILGITRGSLRTKIRSLGITISREIWSEDDLSD